MIVDSSAVLAILNDEPESTEFSTLLEFDPAPKVSAASLVEIAHAAGRTRRREVDELLQTSGATVIAFDHRQAEIARDAFHAFGRGSHHPAKLNFGDCFTYALAKVTGEPLLFKGDDFTHTDLTPAH